MNTRILAPVTSLGILLLASCERDQNQEVASTKVSRTSASAALNPSDSPSARPGSPQGIERRITALADQIHELPDDKLADLVESIIDETDPEQRQQMLTTVYEESDLRPAITRLPLLLEIARSPDVNPDVRDTIMAEFGTTLQTNHGSSWGDWALALEEHLADTEGLIRVE